jgi:hypothetical protein
MSTVVVRTVLVAPEPGIADSVRSSDQEQCRPRRLVVKS